MMVILNSGEGGASILVMTSDPVCCNVDDTVNQAATIMEANQIRRLPVLDFDQNLCGIVTVGDICTHAPHEISGELIEKVSKPGHTFLAESA
jgi:CBS-domain-containing membrane protein